jgi:hypothetical protein
MNDAHGPRRIDPNLHPGVRRGRGLGRIPETPAPIGNRPGGLGHAVEVGPRSRRKSPRPDLADEAAGSLLLDREQAVTHQPPVTVAAQQPRQASSLVIGPRWAKRNVSGSDAIAR